MPHWHVSKRDIRVTWPMELYDWTKVGTEYFIQSIKDKNMTVEGWDLTPIDDFISFSLKITFVLCGNFRNVALTLWIVERHNNRNTAAVSPPTLSSLIHLFPTLSLLLNPTTLVMAAFPGERSLDFFFFQEQDKMNSTHLSALKRQEWKQLPQHLVKIKISISSYNIKENA